MDKDDLRSLLVRSLDGETAAFGEVVARFQSPVLRWTYRVLRNQYDAEDAAQDTFISAYRHLGDLRDLDAFPQWIRRIATSACRRRAQKGQPTISLDDAVGLLETVDLSEDPSTAVARVELQEAVEGAIRSLSTTYRACTKLHYLEGYSVAEVAHFLGIPGGTVKRRLHDARKQLRRR